jgi:hypothetical protein
MWEFFQSALSAIPSAASNKYAFGAYALAISAYVFTVRRVVRHKNLLENIQKLPSKDRLSALEIEIGGVRLAAGISPEQWVRSRIHIYYLFAFLATCVVVITIAALAASETVKEAEVVGTLQPGKEPTPPNGCSGAPRQMVPADALRILIGSNAFFQSGFGKITAIEIGKDPNACQVLTIERTPDGIKVGAELYSEDGKLIARITNNEFHAINGNNSFVKRQNDLSTLVVKSRTTRFWFWTIENELLFVHYLNPTTIRARGLFGCPGHKSVAFTDSGQIGTRGTITDSCINADTAVHID